MWQRSCTPGVSNKGAIKISFDKLTESLTTWLGMYLQSVIHMRLRAKAFCGEATRNLYRIFLPRRNDSPNMESINFSRETD